MTKTEELKYLVQLQSAALDWRLSENDDHKENKVRVDGKWVLRKDAIQVPRANGVGWKWALKSSAQEAQEPPEDEHQCLSY